MRGEVQARLEEAAARLFAERGYLATTVDDIVSAADVSKPALYRHFESKQHLHITMLAKHGEALAAAALGALAAAADLGPDEQIERMITAWFRHVEAHPFVLRLLFADTTGDPEIQAAHRAVQAKQRANDVVLIERFLPDLPAVEREPVAEIIRSSLCGLALWWKDHPEVDRSVLVTAMLRMLTGLRHAAPAADPAT